ncbi:NAD(P)-dependent dehydrogenase (short-subunit alcohol dehydrogenase family) [Actinoplanes octamycinicus]|uniref:NAD(P)-dependent dehydrogenase (Short-subunit alcohol dehydrogenase family) n=1 Tax=Actinoplanes octamycinicus TaxID=135948 RepID=A0A7W7H7C2_9ACTN|nr:SDR family oxidoreductase [Actinoplanes octamycinicus]MBB4745199.1 NAD(P)-dependent dehydrogenase (short-subunit alcohol dehydrogenase family) [Actinoplanes octamycinicus]GIE62674.1 short-chain dehydrogenase [Actinoplanes octamycinicus]
MLADKVVLVAGVGPGLGRAVAVRAAQQGADVVLAARTESYLTEVAGKVTAAGRRALVVPADLTDEDSSAALVRTALDRFGRVDGLVNNAFAMPPMRSLGKVDLDDLRASFDVNVFAALRLTRLLTPALVESGGAVVMVNSAVLRHSRRPFGPYKLAKAGLLAVAQNLASELGPLGVRVNSVAPGWIWADSLRMWFDYQANQRGVPTRQIYDEIAAGTDLRRLPEPDEVADAVLFLLSGLARGITGQCLDVNCGEFHH